MLPAAVVLLGLAAAYLPVELGRPDLPWGLPVAVMAAGATWAWVRFVRRRSWGRGVSALVLSGLVGFHVAWLLSLSAYGEPSAAPAPGDRAPWFRAVRVRDGSAFDPGSLSGRQAVLVFFRGAW